MERPDKIAVVGLWHLGTVVAASWAELGHQVTAVDPSCAVVAGLTAGRAPVFEPGLDDIIATNLRRGRLKFTTDLAAAVTDADFIFLTFDTPVDADDGSDLGPLGTAMREILPWLKTDAVVVVSSQVPVGTCARWREAIRETRHRGTDLVYSPENLRLGDALRCYLHPDRIVVGADQEEAGKRVSDLFAPMGAPIVSMTLTSAEMAKHALNGFLATSISFINEIATLCELAGADVLSVVEALKADSRIGRQAFLSPGFGFAGGTLARDVQVLRRLGAASGAGSPLLDSVLEVNRRRVDLVLQRLTSVYGSVNNLVVGVLGLTYKAGTSTLRRSVALDVIRSLAAAGAKLRAFDPKADLSELVDQPAFELVGDAYAAAEGASALVVMTEWPEFGELDFDRIKALMTRPVIFDGKNCLADLHLDTRGFTYLGVGR